MAESTIVLLVVLAVTTKLSLVVALARRWKRRQQSQPAGAALVNANGSQKALDPKWLKMPRAI